MAEVDWDPSSRSQRWSTTADEHPFGLEYYRSGLYDVVPDVAVPNTAMPDAAPTPPSTPASSETDTRAAAGADFFSIDFYLVLLRKSSPPSFIEPIIDRLDALRHLAVEEGPDQAAPLAKSVRAMFKFLYTNRARINSRPKLFLTYEGNLRAEWEKRFNDRVAIEFLNPVDLRYVVARPNPAHRTRINRFVGSSTVDTFFQDLHIDEL